MLEKNKEAQSQSIAELQQELKSLRALLLARPSPPMFSASSPSGLPGAPTRPSIPAWQLAAASVPTIPGVATTAASEILKEPTEKSEADA
jgi:peroxin-14